MNQTSADLFCPLLSLSDVTRASAVRPVSWPPRPSRRSCLRVSPALASPPTTASPRYAAPRSASDVGFWRVARPWSSTETAGDTWSPLHWTVPRPGSKKSYRNGPRQCQFVSATFLLRMTSPQIYSTDVPASQPLVLLLHHFPSPSNSDAGRWIL